MAPDWELGSLADTAGEWLRGSGPQSEYVMSSRIRLARNLAAYPFAVRASHEDRQAVESRLRTAVLSLPLEKPLTYISVDELSEVDRQFLMERHLVSRELTDEPDCCGVALDFDERTSVMVNEEDHLRIQVMQSGLDLEQAWERVRAIDDQLSERLVYAFHPKLGYLTACPTNVGTGMRVSVMLHLPALSITQQMDKVLRSLQKIGLAVRGLYGEGSQAMGDFFQVSNQITLGLSEEELLTRVGEVTPNLIEWEQRARRHLLEEKKGMLHDRVSRAYGILRTAQQISAEETMHLLSSVRLGVNMGLIGDLEIPTLNEMFMRTQPAHLQKISGAELDSSDRNIERARFLRDHLGDGSNNAA